MGDNDGDGRADLIGVSDTGALWLMKVPTGPSGSATPRLINSGNWVQYNLLF